MLTLLPRLPGYCGTWEELMLPLRDFRVMRGVVEGNKKCTGATSMVEMNQETFASVSISERSNVLSIGPRKCEADTENFHQLRISSP